MHHISRRELKTDEFHDAMERGVEILRTHQKTIWQASLVVVVAAAAFFGWRYYSSRQTAKASAAFARAIAIYDTPVQGTTQQPLPGQATFPSSAAKYTAADQALASVATQYPSTHYGEIARYYSGISLEKLGRYSEAEMWLRPLADGGDTQFKALAQFELAHVYEQMGKSQQAVALYQQLLAKPSVFVPKPVILLALGDHYAAAKDVAQAVKYYEQVKSEYANTGLADQADQRLEMLGKT